MYGGTKQGLSLDDVKNYIVVLPPEGEQDVLVSWIENATMSVDKAMQSAGREIALLREYRTRLIADGVTGKLDVRAAAASLPERPNWKRRRHRPGRIEGKRLMISTRRAGNRRLNMPQPPAQPNLSHCARWPPALDHRGRLSVVGCSGCYACSSQHHHRHGNDQGAALDVPIDCHPNITSASMCRSISATLDHALRDPLRLPSGSRLPG
jgi:hypothetical protein